MAINRQSTHANNSNKHQRLHYLRHPINSYRQIQSAEKQKINQRKEQLINGEPIKDHSSDQNKFFFFLIGILVVLTALFKLYSYLQ
ncbi:hypothetical protein [uncultured Limosilactobacillus sp.]|uniref:hypothetical protein n=1 Tax=uncultured Limosilactobacillus sp. TaxID=2837629 RepID=UPI0025FEC633|nr:hypothetical protein [uncultured Limosilactobacillus sp.]